jgi:hypothetical protein
MVPQKFGLISWYTAKMAGLSMVGSGTGPFGVQSLNPLVGAENMMYPFVETHTFE